MSRVRFGGAPIGNLYTAVADANVAIALAAAVDAGIHSIDTAPLYGHGLSETRIGAFLAERPDALTISTKVGRRLSPVAAPSTSLGFVELPPFDVTFDYSRDGVLRGFDESLARLGVDRIDALLLHDVGRHTHGDDHRAIMRRVRADVLPAMRQLRGEGRVLRIGVGVNEIAVVDELLADGAIDVALLAGRYTLLDQSAGPTLDRCHALGVAVVAGGVFNSGLLVGGTTFDYCSAPPAELTRRDSLLAAARDYGVALPAAALAFPLAHPAIEQIVVGFRSAAEVAETAAWLKDTIAPEFWQALVSRRLLAEDVPQPC